VQSASRAHKLTTTDAGGLYLEQVVYGFSRYHKYTLGTARIYAMRRGQGMACPSRYARSTPERLCAS